VQFVRFKTDGLVAYGLLEGDRIAELVGSIYAEYRKTGAVFASVEVKFLYPCEPTNLYCVGLNFTAHVNELGLPMPDAPANFLKPVSGIVHPGEQIVIPPPAARVDYEGEMAIVIKDRIKNVSVADAGRHIFGVTPLNDVTERELSYTATLVTYSKSFDTFTSFGPVIDTAIDPDDTVVRTYLNGECVQEGRTRELIFSCAEIVSFFSQGRTLFPGDVISTGTPRHVLGMQDGDTVEVEIEGIERRLVNQVYDPKKH
jgi:2-keto-4-pentenoate hydratase/2-oxohepta-3-ene-1,7-dioic acid hydratase in catechol pathway